MRIRELIRRWRKKGGRPGQSLVEFVVLIPVLLVMISGLIEFGFMLNYYLDLTDTAREVARFAVDEDPVHDYVGNFEADPTDACTPPRCEPYNFYYLRIPNQTTNLLDLAGQISLDAAAGDDIVVSIFSVDSGTIVNRFPPFYTEPANPRFGPPYCDQGGELGWRWQCNQTSQFTSAEVEADLDAGAPDTGLVLVEIYYHYDMLLALPWITAFVPNPIRLHAYSLMPNASATP